MPHILLKNSLYSECELILKLLVDNEITGMKYNVILC